MNLDNFDVVNMRSELHQIPELGFHEEKTSDYVAKKLEEMGLKVTRGIGKTGVVAYIEGEEPGPVVMLRADMDALPFVEDGKEVCIHACGHDCHTAMVLATAARMIGKVKKGKLKLFFQPAEETLRGALESIEDGVLNDVEMAVGAHIRPVQDIPAGTVCAAVRHTSSTFMYVDLKGLAAHASRPHLGRSTVEASVLATAAVNAIWMNPGQAWSAKVTSISCSASAPNIIPDRGQMILDIRASTNPLMKELLAKVEAAIKSATSIVGVEATVSLPGGVIPAAEYDEALVDEMRTVIKETLGEDKLANDCGGGGEDFHYFVQTKADIHPVYIGVGAGATPGLHHPQMTLDAEQLRVGVKVLEAFLRKKLG
ncbi:MAG: amidohydrolase [Burkholderiaceae bacterium]|nr:amidohydrolase [Burkholderiaceae bacterium]